MRSRMPRAARNWFGLPVPTDKVDAKGKTKTTRQGANQVAGKPFEGDPPPFLNVEHEKRDLAIHIPVTPQ